MTQLGILFITNATGLYTPANRTNFTYVSSQVGTGYTNTDMQTINLARFEIDVLLPPLEDLGHFVEDSKAGC